MESKNFIKSCRKQMRLTQVEFAERLGTTQQKISLYEAGKAIPRLSIGLKIIDLFQTRGLCPFCDNFDPWGK